MKENEAHEYCVNNGIRVSPWAANRGPKNNQYRIAISLGGDWRTVHKSPEIYSEDAIWDKITETEYFYFNKSLNKKQ